MPHLSLIAALLLPLAATADPSPFGNAQVPLVVKIDSTGLWVDSLAVVLENPFVYQQNSSFDDLSSKPGFPALAQVAARLHPDTSQPVELHAPPTRLRWYRAESILRGLSGADINHLELVSQGTSKAPVRTSSFDWNPATDSSYSDNIVPAVDLRYNHLKFLNMERAHSSIRSTTFEVDLESSPIESTVFDSLGQAIRARFQEVESKGPVHLFVSRTNLSFEQLCRLVRLIDSTSGQIPLLRLDRNLPKHPPEIYRSRPESTYVESVKPSPTEARILGLGRLYFSHLGSDAANVKLDKNIAALLPLDGTAKLGRIRPNLGTSWESIICTGDSGSDWWAVSADHRLPDIVPGHRLMIREAGIHAYTLKERPIYLALYDNDRRTSVWGYFGASGKTLPNYRIHQILSNGVGGVKIRLEGSMFRNGFAEVKGVELELHREGNSLVLGSVVSPFTIFPFDEIRTESIVAGNIVTRSIKNPSERALAACKVGNPLSDDDWTFDWQKLTKSTRCITSRKGAKIEARKIGMPSFIESGWRE